MNKPTSILLAIAGTLAISSAFAAGPATTGIKSAKAEEAVTASLSPKQRGAAIGQFVRKWGPYVENVYAVDVHTWSKKMVGQFAVGDAGNIQRALQRDTFEGAVAELDGVGHRLSDERVITKLAASSVSNPSPMALGDIDKDLVYTPITPCRLVDTRLAGGVVLAGSTRDFGAYGYPDFVRFGGSSTDCGLAAERMTTAVINITAVLPDAGGFATAYAGNLGARPLASSVNYTAGGVTNNSVMVNINPVGATPDWKLYSSATSHFVADIVGFYDNPYASPLQCVNTSSTQVTLGVGASNVGVAPACAAGYTRTSTNCRLGEYGAHIVGIDDSQCFAKNDSASVTTMSVSARCCRVPGR